MLNLPNLLTFLRIILIPFIMVLMVSGDSFYSQTLATILFLIASITDWFDGLIARKMNISTPLGIFLDPIADKLIAVGVLLMLCATGKVTGWHIIPVAIIFFREIFVSGLREYLGNFSVKLPVSDLATCKTFMQLAAIPFLIYFPVWEAFFTIGLTFLWIAAGFTLITGWQYLKTAYGYMKQ